MTKKSFIKTIGSKGLLADYNTEGKKLQSELTAGDNITIDGNTISSDQVFVAKYGTTTYQEIKNAYDAGKICVIFRNELYYYINLIENNRIRFISQSTNPALGELTVFSNDSWEVSNTWLQSRLTFDTSPKTGSNNPVTSDGINTAINAKADGNNSVAIFDGYMRRMNESTGWRKLAYKQFNYTNTNINALFRLYLIGGNNDHIGLGDLIVNIRFNSSGSAPDFKACNLISNIPLHTSIKLKVVGVAGNAVVEVWFRPPTFSMLMLSCLGNGSDVSAKIKDWTFGRYLEATDPEPVEDTANHIYVFSGTDRRVQLNIASPTNDNLVAMDANGLVKDSGLTKSSVERAISSAGSAIQGVKVNGTTLTPDENKIVNVPLDDAPKAGSNNPVTSDGIKTALDSRIPAPTSTTGTQVLKCINGVIQWVTE